MADVVSLKLDGIDRVGLLKAFRKEITEEAIVNGGQKIILDLSSIHRDIVSSKETVLLLISSLFACFGVRHIVIVLADSAIDDVRRLVERFRDKWISGTFPTIRFANSFSQAANLYL